jgi:hypothetical protein
MAFSTRYVQFDGVDEYVLIGNVLAFERTQAFSISTWVRGPFPESLTPLIGKELGSTSFRGYVWRIEDDGNLYFILMSDLDVGNLIEVRSTSATAAADGDWHNLVATYAGGSLAANVHLYIDGAAIPTTVNSDALTDTIVSTADLKLAADGSSNYFGGDMDEVSVYTKELSFAEVTWIYNSGVPRDLAGGGAPSDLVGWWRVGEGDTFPTLLDSSVGSHNGTMTNMESGDIKDLVTEIEAEATVRGDSSALALGLLRKPYIPVVATPPSEVGPPRLMGFQPGRPPVVKEPSMSVSPNLPRRRG